MCAVVGWFVLCVLPFTQRAGTFPEFEVRHAERAVSQGNGR